MAGGLTRLCGSISSTLVTYPKVIGGDVSCQPIAAVAKRFPDGGNQFCLLFRPSHMAPSSSLKNAMLQRLLHSTV
eukprot:6220405-Amphidinium_carterae.1